MRLPSSMALRSGFGAIVLSVALALPAAAAPASVVTNVNIRIGPGETYPVSDILMRGDLVEVDRCDYGWCYVRYGHEGWVAESLLQPAHEPQRYGFPMTAPMHQEIYIPSYVMESAPRPYGHEGQRYGVDTGSAW